MRQIVCVTNSECYSYQSFIDPINCKHYVFLQQNCRTPYVEVGKNDRFNVLSISSCPIQSSHTTPHFLNSPIPSKNRAFSRPFFSLVAHLFAQIHTEIAQIAATFQSFSAIQPLCFFLKLDILVKQREVKHEVCDGTWQLAGCQGTDSLMI